MSEKEKNLKKLVDYFIEKDFGKLKPRNPKRIKRILKLIGELWIQVPDQRLGQLLENYVFSHEGGFDMWNQEDDVTEARLKEELKSETRNE